MSSRIAVVDFETTGSSPGQGARATEVAIVMIEGGQVVGSFQSLMNAGVWVPPFITQLTGITNAMVAAAPAAGEVMREAHAFVAGAPMVAHNAPFDRGFWQAELARVGCDAAHPYACTVRLSRRLFPNALNHKLGTLVDYHGIESAGAAHRALADASVTAQLLLRMQGHLREHCGVANPQHDFLLALQACPKARLPEFLERYSQQA
ncbi:MAG: 3'-5' exonuclease [Giesbergeria sp.]